MLVLRVVSLVLLKALDLFLEVANLALIAGSTCRFDLGFVLGDVVVDRGHGGGRIVQAARRPAHHTGYAPCRSRFVVGF